MSIDWESLRLAAKAADREKAFREHWPAVAEQLRQWGCSSWGIALAHRVLSSGGSVREAVEALHSDEESTEAGRARVQRLKQMACQQGFALWRSNPAIPPTIGSRWTIVDPGTHNILAPTERTARPAMNLDDVEAWLTREGM